MLGNLSRLINRATGGARGETLCARFARRYGSRCLFCRVVGWAVDDKDHCLRELQ